ncbi:MULTISPECIES: hypothetical protein [unclassified Caballeronia]|uniref:hypothetical protein n=1 Tax=unclassified Caballeronia TaxID=2646786 RepID=UPI00286532D5|nr:MULTISPECIES: hypothetical protein [unclassified Caballeronia]MDR5777761.1 hypothetical protein [Caballeronia sp. LZ002]MDR5853196.1 hypothetical protein [Caballeronia sp. LZ003]
MNEDELEGVRKKVKGTIEEADEKMNEVCAGGAKDNAQQADDEGGTRGWRQEHPNNGTDDALE